jgi:hypothetical protein
MIDGDADALARHAESLVTIGGDFADTGERVHSTWQQLAPCYLAPEAGQLLAATGPAASSRSRGTRPCTPSTGPGRG